MHLIRHEEWLKPYMSLEGMGRKTDVDAYIREMT
jgi:hypothetical protein